MNSPRILISNVHVFSIVVIRSYLTPLAPQAIIRKRVLAILVFTSTLGDQCPGSGTRLDPSLLVHRTPSQNQINGS
jgi:hypothetical protein